MASLSAWRHVHWETSCVNFVNHFVNLKAEPDIGITFSFDLFGKKYT
jgi:hypothetical protein